MVVIDVYHVYQHRVWLPGVPWFIIVRHWPDSWLICKLIWDAWTVVFMPNFQGFFIYRFLWLAVLEMHSRTKINFFFLWRHFQFDNSKISTGSDVKHKHFTSGLIISVFYRMMSLYLEKFEFFLFSYFREVHFSKIENSYVYADKIYHRTKNNIQE